MTTLHHEHVPDPFQDDGVGVRDCWGRPAGRTAGESRRDWRRSPALRVAAVVLSLSASRFSTRWFTGLASTSTTVSSVAWVAVAVTVLICD